MSISFTLNLKCPDCGAGVTYVDEKPEWKEDGAILKGVAEAKAFLEQYQGQPPKGTQLPTYIHRNQLSGKCYMVDVDPHYVECPACPDGRIYRHPGD